MTERKSRFYWDSDCFLGWLQEEQDKVDDCRGVLDEAATGQATIITSALTIAEVLAMRGRMPIPVAQRTKVEAFFRRESIAVVNVTRRLAEAARGMVWDHGIAPKDALHVATALEAKVDSLHTFDAGLIRKNGLVGVPSLIICKPSVPQKTLDLTPGKSL